LQVVLEEPAEGKGHQAPSIFLKLRFGSISVERPHPIGFRGATYLDSFDMPDHAVEIYDVHDNLSQLYDEVQHASETRNGRDLFGEL
jgi:hypothetical protein